MGTAPRISAIERAIGKKPRTKVLNSDCQSFGEELVVEKLPDTIPFREAYLKIDKLQIGIIGHELATWLLVLVQDSILGR